MEVTGTFKIRKVNLQKEGFEVAAIAAPLWLRVAGETDYVPLTVEMEARIRSGEQTV